MEVQQPASPEQISDDDTGIHRSYLCIFCKRGFCTAQALGGHMNIHRKDRAKISRQTELKEEYSSSNHSLLYQHGPYHSNLSRLSFFSPEVLMRSYNMSSKRKPNELMLFGDDHGRIGGIGGEEMRNMRDENEGGMDLELRLGLRPSM